jgi:hypothetical protein
VNSFSGIRLADKLALFLGTLIALCLLSVQVHAQDKSKGQGPGKKKTAVTFEDQLIEGEVKRPEFFYFLQKKQFNFGRLIKLRENFLPEERKTSEAIQRRSGGAD